MVRVKKPSPTTDPAAGRCPSEETFARLVEGGLDLAAQAALHAHLDRCPDCRRLLVFLARSSLGRSNEASGERRHPRPGITVGRFVLLDRLGAGSASVVFSAYDPKLDRKVALKLLRFDDDPGGRAMARLHHEARTIAQLSHPNIIVVHDVGLEEGQLYIAMEHVAGQTLSGWCDARPRHFRAVVAMFEQAAQGLAAAHRVGVIHRDFKPANVLVGDDGRVRVTDFGQARLLSEPGGDGDSSAEAEARPGRLAGTPAYMAPEQWLGRPPDPRADQFAFCVSLYEALYGARPFDAEGPHALRERVLAGEPRPPSRASSVPRRLTRIVQRGLSRAPEDRFPSMDALVQALRRLQRRRPVRVAVVIAALAVASGVTVHLKLRARAPVCAGARERLGGVWDAERERAVQRAFLKVKRRYARDTWPRVRRRLAAFADTWVALHTRFCRATRVHGEQSEALLDLRMDCLSRSLDELRALVDRFERADARTVRRALASVDQLASPRRCADASALMARAPPPASPDQRARVGRLRARLARIKALRITGHYREALRRVERAWPEIRALGHAPLTAAAALERGSALHHVGRYDAAETALHRAVREALAGRDDALAVWAWNALAFVLEKRRELSRAMQACGYAEALAGRAGERRELLLVLHNTRGGILNQQTRYAESLDEFRRALRLARKLHGDDHRRVATLLMNIGGVLNAMGRIDEARRHLRRSRVLRERVLGRRHPRVAATLSTLAATHYDAGDYTEAIRLWRRSAQINEEALEPDHPRLTNTRALIAAALVESGDPRTALTLARRALASDEARLGAEHPRLARPLWIIARCHEVQGTHDEALRGYRRALSIRSRRAKAGDFGVADLRFKLARTHLAMNQPRQARPLLEAALQAFQIGRGGDPALRAEVEFALARSLWALSGDRERAARLAARARPVFESHPRLRRQPLQPGAWLRARPGR
jgi:tetratricopeptide (TPR) repeat protein